MQRVILVASAIASVAFAGTEEIRALIQQKLQLDEQIGAQVVLNEALKAIDCSAHENLFCPLDNVPNVQFAADGGNVSSSASACCPAKFTQCEVQDNAQYCRALVMYEIPETSGNNQDLCPATTPDCTCQQTYSERRDLRLRFCPSTTDCCPVCECHGDPHCRAFNGQQAIWATCDDRDPTCVHSSTTCSTTSYGGQQCKWVPAKPGQQAYCARADGTPTPEMVMYAKSYKSYFNPLDNVLHYFQLNLTLGTYGSITRIDMIDTGKDNNVYSWYIDAAGNCHGNPTYPINPNNAVAINNLPSMVTMWFQCNAAAGRSPTSGRFDIHVVQDPWYQGDTPILGSFWGFCATGQITESLSEAKGGCNTVDRQIVKYFGCSPNTNLDKCKANWCQNNALRFNYNALGGVFANPSLTQRRAQCTAFVTDKNPANIRNYLAAVCSISNAVAGPNPSNIDPTACATNDACKACMDNIMDFPEDIANILQGPAVTIPPTKICPDLLTIGLNRKTLAKQASGVVIEYQNNVTLTWSGVFALLNEEIAQCDCKTIFVNGTDAANLVLTQPGSYRIRQCNGLDNSPDQDLCTSAPAYNTTVIYSNPTGGPVVSEPLGVLFDQGKLVCNKAIFPGCPPDYGCCVWLNSKQGWTTCMVDAYGPGYSVLYPNCKFPGGP